MPKEEGCLMSASGRAESIRVYADLDREAQPKSAHERRLYFPEAA